MLGFFIVRISISFNAPLRSNILVTLGSISKWPLEQGFTTAREETETIDAAPERPQLICIRFSRYHPS